MKRVTHNHFLPTSTRRNESRSGWTLLELLAAIGIIVVLIAISFPAISFARESARRMQCSSNLKQLGLAVSNYASTHRRVPTCSYFAKHGTASSFATLLPYLEHEAAFERLARTGRLGPERIPVYACPSASQQSKFITYAASISSDSISFDGAFGCGKLRQAVQPSPFPLFRASRGLTQTALYSETSDSDSPRAVASEHWRHVSEPSPWKDEGGFLAACASIPDDRLTDPTSPKRGHAGFVMEGFFGAFFNHAVPPNTFVCICQDAVGAMAANSDHTGGAYVVYGDAHVGFVTNDVDPAVWSSQGDFR